MAYFFTFRASGRPVFPIKSLYFPPGLSRPLGGIRKFDPLHRPVITSIESLHNFPHGSRRSIFVDPFGCLGTEKPRRSRSMSRPPFVKEGGLVAEVTFTWPHPRVI